MSETPLFQGMDEQEQALAPEQLPEGSSAAERVMVDRPTGTHGGDEIVIPVGGLIGGAGRGETPGVAGGPGPVIPPTPVVPDPPTPGDVPIDGGSDPAH